MKSIKFLVVVALFVGAGAMAADAEENAEHKTAPLDRVWDSFFSKTEEAKAKKKKQKVEKEESSDDKAEKKNR